MPDAAATSADDPLRARILHLSADDAIVDEWRDTWQAFKPKRKERQLSTRAVQTHYRPFVGGRLIVEGTIRRTKGRPPAHQTLYLHVLPTPELAAERFAIAAARKRWIRCRGPAVFAIPEHAAIAWALPNGPRLRNLRSYVHTRPFRRTLARVGHADADREDLQRPRLIRYVPRKRALLHWSRSDGDAYIKLYSPGDDLVAAANLQALTDRQGVLDFRVPSLIGHDRHRRGVFMAGLPGIPFTARIPELEPAAFADVGAALASLHRADLTPRRRWTPTGELGALTAAMRDVVAVLPGLRRAVETEVGRLGLRAAELRFPLGAPIHGNVFGDQILLEGGGVGIVDWDDLALGDPLYDLGRMIAHLIFVARRESLPAAPVARCVAALCDGWQRAGGSGVDAARLRWHVATALLMRAKISALRVLDADWITACTTGVDDARRVTDRDDDWLAGLG